MGIPFREQPLGDNINFNKIINPLTFTTSAGNFISIEHYGNSDILPKIYYNRNGEGWMPYTIGSRILFTELDSTLSFFNSSNYFSSGSDDYFYFFSDSSRRATGRISSLMNYSTRCKPYCFRYLFKGCPLIKAPFLNYYFLAPYCYSHIFDSIERSSFDDVSVSFDDWYGTATDNWMRGVVGSSITGSIYVPSSFRGAEIYDDSHIPNGWRIRRIG